MKSLYVFTLVLLLATGSHAFPRWAVQEDSNCSTCHLYQGGGAARNSYGKDFVRESLVFKDMTLPWQNEESESSFSFGLDTRYMAIQQEDKDLRSFPMQFALYGGMEVGSFVAHAEVNRLQEEFRVTGGLRYQGLPFEGYVSVQREMPALGWRVDDHTLYSRGGNLTPGNFSQEGMPFTPFLDPPTGLEMGAAPLMGLELSLWMGEGFLQSQQLNNSDLHQGAKASYRYAGDLFIAQVGVAGLQEGEVTLSALSGGLSVYGLVWLGELSTAENWALDGSSNTAILQQLSYRVRPGVEVVGRYEFYDPNTDYLSGSLDRFGIGVDLYLIPGLEIKLSYRDAAVGLPQGQAEITPQYLTQIHLYL